MAFPVDWYCLMNLTTASDITSVLLKHAALKAMLLNRMDQREHFANVKYKIIYFYLTTTQTSIHNNV